MIDNINEVDKKTIKNIGSDFLKWGSIKRIEHKYNQFDHNEILSIIKEYGISDDDLRADVSWDFIGDDKIIVISDTHIGSELENLKYIKMLYEYASKNGVKQIIHGGDFFHSTMHNVKLELVDTLAQAYYAIEKYPKGEVDSFILLGNHDKHMIDKNKDVKKILRSREDFKVIGFKRSYLNWCNNLIVISHKIDSYKFVIPNIDPLLNLVGHHHSFDVKDNRILLPTLSDDLKKYSSGVSLPGFILLEKDGRDIDVKYYTFDNNQIILQQEVLKRRLNFHTRAY